MPESQENAGADVTAMRKEIAWLRAAMNPTMYIVDTLRMVDDAKQARITQLERECLDWRQECMMLRSERDEYKRRSERGT